MGKLSIGDADIPQMEEKKRKIKELTVLERDSEQSIYHLIFAQKAEATEHEGGNYR